MAESTYMSVVSRYLRIRRSLGAGGPALPRSLRTTLGSNAGAIVSEEKKLKYFLLIVVCRARRKSNAGAIKSEMEKKPYLL